MNFKKKSLSNIRQHNLSQRKQQKKKYIYIYIRTLKPITVLQIIQTIILKINQEFEHQVRPISFFSYNSKVREKSYKK